MSNLFLELSKTTKDKRKAIFNYIEEYLPTFTRMIDIKLRKNAEEGYSALTLDVQEISELIPPNLAGVKAKLQERDKIFDQIFVNVLLKHYQSQGLQVEDVHASGGRSITLLWA